jgi:hypothetical protein
MQHNEQPTLISSETPTTLCSNTHIEQHLKETYSHSLYMGSPFIIANALLPTLLT